MSSMMQETNESIFETGQSSSPFTTEGQGSACRPPVLTSDKINRQEVKRTRQTNASVPKDKSAHLLSSLRFACSITSNQYLSYQLQQSDPPCYEELDKLDVVLPPNSSLLIHCKFLLNGLEVLESPLNWIKDTLNEIMGCCGFAPSTQDDNQEFFRYTIKKAFVTTPLSYLLIDQSVSYGVLYRLDLIFNWSTVNKSKEFQSIWKRTLLQDPQMKIYMAYLLQTILFRKTCHLYPLIFSNTYVKRLSQTVAYIPHIAHSLQKVLTTSKATMSVDNHAFSERFEQELKVMKKNTQIMIQKNESVRDTLTLGMYHSVKQSQQLKPPQNTQNAPDPPNALWAVSLLWSASYSSIIT